jgi:hypothetical protein
MQTATKGAVAIPAVPIPHRALVRGKNSARCPSLVAEKVMWNEKET